MYVNACCIEFIPIKELTTGVNAKRDAIQHIHRLCGSNL